MTRARKGQPSQPVAVRLTPDERAELQKYGQTPTEAIRALIRLGQVGISLEQATTNATKAQQALPALTALPWLKRTDTTTHDREAY